MEEQRRRISSVPDLAEVEKERNRLKRRKEYGNALRGTCFSLLAVAAIAVLAATLFLPVLQVTGTSMEPTLYDGDIIVLTKKSSINRGDLCGFYYQNKLLLNASSDCPVTGLTSKRTARFWGMMKKSMSRTYPERALASAI